MVNTDWMGNEERKKAEKFKNFRMEALCSIRKKSSMICTVEGEEALANEFPNGVSFACLAEEPKVFEIPDSLIRQMHEVQKEAGEEVAKAEKQTKDNQIKLQKLEAAYAAAVQSKSDCEEKIRSIIPGREKEKLNMQSYVKLYEQKLKDLQEKQNDYNYYADKINQVNTKSTFELIFRPDIVFPLAGKQDKITSLWNECQTLTSQTRDAYDMYCKSTIQWLEDEQEYQKTMEQIAESGKDASEAQKCLMEESQEITYWLEWFILCGIFEAYLKSQDTAMEIDNLLKQIDEEAPLLASYGDVKEALEYWRDREAHPEYLEQKIKKLETSQRG